VLQSQFDRNAQDVEVSLAVSTQHPVEKPCRCHCNTRRSFFKRTPSSWMSGYKDALPQGRASRIGMQWRGKQLPFTIFTISQYKYTKLVLYKKPSTVRFLRQALMLY